MPDTFGYQLVGVEEALAMFDPEKVIAAARMATNTVTRDTRVEGSRLIRQEFSIKAGDVSQYLQVTSRATGYEIQGVISGFGRGMALGYFSPQQAQRSRISYIGKGRDRRVRSVLVKGDVTVQVRMGGGRRVVSASYGNRPFVQVMKSGHVGVWVRTGKARLPIEQLFGPGVGGTFGSTRVVSALQAFVDSRLPAEFNRVLTLKLQGQL